MNHNLKLFTGLALASFLFIGRAALAGPVATPSTAAPSSIHYLHIHTGDGQALDASVQSFKGISLAVMMTLKKQGKLPNANEPASDPNGYMTYVLAPDVSPAFVNWAKAHAGKGAIPNATGEFTWTDPNGKPSYVFEMSALRVVRFIPADAKGANGGQVELSADTQSFPPIQFKPKK